MDAAAWIVVDVPADFDEGKARWIFVERFGQDKRLFEDSALWTDERSERSGETGPVLRSQGEAQKGGQDEQEAQEDEAPEPVDVNDTGEPGHQVEKYERALKYAQANAEKVAEGQEDGGTCNHDTPYVRDVKNESALRVAAENVGLKISDGFGIAEGGLMILRATRGQGNLRSQMAGAFAKGLKACNMDAHVRRAMD